MTSVTYKNISHVHFSFFLTSSVLEFRKLVVKMTADLHLSLRNMTL